MDQENTRIAEIQTDIRLSQHQESERVAEAYLEAVKTRDLRALSQLLHPQVQFVSPSGTTQGRETFLGTLQRVLAHVEKVEVTDRLTAPGQAAFVYNMFFAPSSHPVPAVSVLTHENGQIKKVEMIDDKKFLPDRFERENNSPS